jgi:tetratricopeptide (TPR) repeat protein
MNIDDLINDFKKNLPSEILGRKVNPEALVHITLGDKAFHEDNYDQAIAQYTKAIDLDSTNWFSLYQRGKCYRITQNYDRALEDLFKSKTLDDNFENNQDIAECYLFKNEFSKAASYYDTAIEKLEHSETIDIGDMMGIDYGATKARCLNNQAVCYLNLKLFDKAINCTTKGIQASPNYPNNYSTMGIIYLQQGNHSQAINNLQKAAQLGDLRANDILSRI